MLLAIASRGVCGVIRRSFVSLVLGLGFLVAASAPALAQPDSRDGLPPPPKPVAKGKDDKPAPRLEPTKDADGNLIFYRRVSSWELKKLLSKGGLFVTPGSGESFIST